jgi:hypothetical protein
MKHVIGILTRPCSEWASIRDDGKSAFGYYLRYLVWIALLPPLAWYFGATQSGWELNDRVIRLTPASAAQIMSLFYVAILFSIAFLGCMIHWMAKTYDARNDDVAHGIAVAAYMCAPMFLVGLRRWPTPCICSISAYRLSMTCPKSGVSCSPAQQWRLVWY